MFNALRKNWKVITIATLLALNVGMTATNLQQEVRLFSSDQVVMAARQCASCWH